jgi:hypothetical protein
VLGAAAEAVSDPFELGGELALETSRPAERSGPEPTWTLLSTFTALTSVEMPPTLAEPTLVSSLTALTETSDLAAELGAILTAALPVAAFAARFEIV